MPELPEVETVRRELESHILNKKIIQVKVFDEAIIQTSAKEFQTLIQQRSWSRIARIGKLLIFFLNNDQVMLAHLKMTGQFLYKDQEKILAGIYPLLYASTPGGEKTAGHFREQQRHTTTHDQHTHVLFQFADGSELAFRDQRKFGYLKIISIAELPQVLAKFGPDPLSENFTEERFAKAFHRRKKSLKGVLMDQGLIAGIGNIYADEICHRVGLRPQRSVQRLSAEKINELFQATLDIIRQAVDHKGTTLRDFTRPDGGKGEHAFSLQVYSRENSTCHRCPSGIIKKIWHLGRGTHYCPACQE